MGAGLSGATVASLIAAFFGDQHGRRRMFVELALLSAAGAAILCVANNLWVVLAAAFVGMLNGMGRDRGAALVLDQAVLPTLLGDDDELVPSRSTICSRTWAMRWGHCWPGFPRS